MGNRAVIADKDLSLGIYVHWNGGIDSVTAFLKYCEKREFRPFPDGYGVARLTQVIANFFGGDLSIGLTTEPKEWAVNCDNGLYIVDGWEIIAHTIWRHPPNTDSDTFEEVDIWGDEYHEGYDLNKMLRDIDVKQPIDDRIFKEDK